jgi:hypothetical protein
MFEWLAKDKSPSTRSCYCTSMIGIDASEMTVT